jgi:Family of unknown function (DUF6281)
MMLARFTLLLGTLALLAASCGGSDGRGGSGGPSPEPTAGGDAAGACALMVEYEGAAYYGTYVKPLPDGGEPIGTGVVPACDDGGGAVPADEVELLSIPGVSPEVAVATRSGDTVFVRDGEELPRKLRRLVETSG